MKNKKENTNSNDFEKTLTKIRHISFREGGIAVFDGIELAAHRKFPEDKEFLEKLGDIISSTKDAMEKAFKMRGIS